MANKMMGYVICGYSSVDNLMSDQGSPFRRWTTGSGSSSSYRHHDHRSIYSKQMSEGSNASNGVSNGGVARWSLGLEHLLADTAGAAAFAHFLDKEFAAENIRFWWSCEQYRTCEGPGADNTRTQLADQIWQRHLADGAPEPVNIDAAAKRATALRLNQVPLPADLFNQAQKQIFNVMKFDSYPRFLRSGVHAECARADLRGLPPPYGAAPGAAPAPVSPDNSTKIKKSMSNASERRRSGAGSLLPWRLRAASRERDTGPAPDNAPMAQVPQVPQVAAGCSLCRVVLPDGATSVVGVEQGVSVRRLVDRLLQRRKLPVHTYVVLLPDQEGESREVQLDGPSSALGGRCAVVERRCVVRVALGSRCVAVRARPERRLRHVLRPLLTRYAPAAAPAAGPVRPLHPDTLLQELDGARLQIVELEGEWRAVLCGPGPGGDGGDLAGGAGAAESEGDDDALVSGS
ncbi:regulator of G-protein signaling loco-like [Leptidea sinapis]|uniref:regulator of G-protein signaling loco-like n=1 Tax=Leptidea sinapis TaxID=189913 RepID=UPI0021C33095|nr:regulator of G-protein signaling loco-like [Leptidea sinapis]